MKGQISIETDVRLNAVRLQESRVITSYSIHYTKLYEAEIERRLPRLIESDQISGFLHERVRPLLDDPSAALAELHRLNADPASASHQDWVVVASWAAYFGDQARNNFV